MDALLIGLTNFCQKKRASHNKETLKTTTPRSYTPSDHPFLQIRSHFLSNLLGFVVMTPMIIEMSQFCEFMSDFSTAGSLLKLQFVLRHSEWLVQTVDTILIKE